MIKKWCRKLLQYSSGLFYLLIDYVQSKAWYLCFHYMLVIFEGKNVLQTMVPIRILVDFSETAYDSLYKPMYNNYLYLRYDLSKK